MHDHPVNCHTLSRRFSVDHTCFSYRMTYICQHDKTQSENARSQLQVHSRFIIRCYPSSLSSRRPSHRSLAPSRAMSSVPARVYNRNISTSQTEYVLMQCRTGLFSLALPVRVGTGHRQIRRATRLRGNVPSALIRRKPILYDSLPSASVPRRIE